jgi:plasmid stabilization system protein ParE
MFEVRWKRSTLDRLTELWIGAEDRAAVNDAVDQIDHLLAHNPLDTGESRSGAIRILFEPPLGVFFEIDDRGRVVHVLRVWTF